MSGFDVKYTRLSLSVRYGSVLFPLDTLRFLMMLREADFILADRLEEAILAGPLGAHIEVGGVVARKGEIGVRINPDRQVLAIHALDPVLAVTEMDALESLLREKAGINSPEMSVFYELLLDAVVEASESPIQRWGSLLDRRGFLERASQLIGEEVAPFGIRLSSAGQVPNQSDWFDIRIEPQVVSPAEFHSISVVFRKSSREEVFEFVRNLERTLSGLVSLVEEG